MESVWSDSCKFDKRDTLLRDIECDVLIIGAGIAGILTGYFLQESGKNVIIIERNRIASGNTKKTTAKITSQHDLIYEDTKALEIKENLVVTNRGDIKARDIVVATHYPIMNAPGYYFMKMHQERSYVIDIEDAEDVEGMYIDEEKGGYSFRNYNGLLLLGGVSHRTGENEE